MVLIITPEQMNQIIDDPHNPSHVGKFMYITSDDQYICCDNETGAAFVEKFNDLITATKWLNGLIEMDDIHDNEKLLVKYPGALT